MVKCTTCGNRWRAFQDRSLPERETAEEEMLVEAPRPAPAREDDVEFVAPPVVPERKSAPAREKQPSPTLAVGVGVVALLGVTLGGLVLFRQPVATAVPATAPIFAAIGLPVNTLGLVIEGVKSQATFQAGRPVLSVTGAIRNVNKAPTEAPPIRINLLGHDGKPVAGLLAQPLNARIPPGAIRYFAVTLPDPPSGARELEILFQPAGKGGDTASAEARPPVAETPAPPVVEAQPLPATSPDALKTHEQH